MNLQSPREDTRCAILVAADSLFQRYGYKKTTMEDIAQEGGVSRATIYLYFANKEEIALASAERNNRLLRDELEQIAKQEEAPTHRLRNLLLRRVLSRFDFAQPYSQSLDELFSALRAPIMALKERQNELEAQIIAEVLQAGAREGEFHCPEPLETARLLVLATSALFPYSLSASQLGARAEIEAKAKALIKLLLEGLLPRE